MEAGNNNNNNKTGVTENAYESRGINGLLQVSERSREKLFNQGNFTDHNRSEDEYFSSEKDFLGGNDNEEDNNVSSISKDEEINRVNFNFINSGVKNKTVKIMVTSTDEGSLNYKTTASINPDINTGGNDKKIDSSNNSPLNDNTTSNTSDSNNNNQRRRISKACDICRKKKIRCDGKSPKCSYCDSHKYECIFTPRIKKRATPRSAKYIRELESNFIRLKNVLKALHPNLSENSIEELEASVLNTNNIYTTASSPSVLSTSGQSPASCTNNSNIESDTIVNEELSSEFVMLGCGNESEKLYFGPSSIHNLLTNAGFKWIFSQTNDISFIQELQRIPSRELFSCIELKYSFLIESAKRSPLPSYEIAIMCLNDYYRLFYTSCPFSNYKKSLEIINHAYKCEEANEHISQYYSHFLFVNSLISLILTISIITQNNLYFPFTSDQDLNTSDPPASSPFYSSTYSSNRSNYSPDKEFDSADPTPSLGSIPTPSSTSSTDSSFSFSFSLDSNDGTRDYVFIASTAFKNALSVYPLSANSGPSMIDIIAIVMFSLCLYSSPMMKMGIHVASCAFRMAQQLGLNRRVVGLDENEIRFRKLLFWAAFELDADFSTRFCAPPSANLSDLSQEMITIDDLVAEYSLMPFRNPSERAMAKANLHIVFLNFRLLSVRVYNRLYSATANSLSQAETHNVIGSLDEDIQSWAASVPEEYRLSSLLEPNSIILREKDPTLKMQLISIFLSYHNLLLNVHKLSIHCRLGLFRKFKTTDSNSTNDDENGFSFSNSSSEPMKYPRLYSSASICIESARSISSLLKFLTHEFPHWWVVFPFLINAFMTLFVNVIQNSKTGMVRTDLANLKIVVEFLDKLSNITRNEKMLFMYTLFLSMYKLAYRHSFKSHNSMFLEKQSIGDLSFLDLNVATKPLLYGENFQLDFPSLSAFNLYDMLIAGPETLLKYEQLRKKLLRKLKETEGSESFSGFFPRHILKEVNQQRKYSKSKEDTYNEQNSGNNNNNSMSESFNGNGDYSEKIIDKGRVSDSFSYNNDVNEDSMKNNDDKNNEMNYQENSLSDAYLYPSLNTNDISVALGGRGGDGKGDFNDIFLNNSFGFSDNLSQLNEMMRSEIPISIPDWIDPTFFNCDYTTNLNGDDKQNIGQNDSIFNNQSSNTNIETNGINLSSGANLYGMNEVGTERTANKNL